MGRQMGEDLLDYWVTKALWWCVGFPVYFLRRRVSRRAERKEYGEVLCGVETTNAAGGCNVDGKTCGVSLVPPSIVAAHACSFKQTNLKNYPT